MSDAIIVSNPTSKVVLTHPFKDILPDVDEFFKSKGNAEGVIQTINSLCYKIKKLAKKYALRIDENKFKGDALELFVEYMMKTNAADNRVGIYEYSTVIDEDDVGVDGNGVGENGHPATVQVKYRGGNYVLTANEDHLSNFLTSSWYDFAVRMEDDKNMLIVTTGCKVDEYSREKMLKGSVRVLARDALREMFDNRPEWWLQFWEAVKASRTQKCQVTVKTLREHQEEAVSLSIADTADRGKIILPPGTGKTLIEAELAFRTIASMGHSVVTPVIKVNSPRILLCFQLFEEFFDYFSSKGLAVKYVNFNSGQSDDRAYIAKLRKSGGVFREIISTTSIKELKEAHAAAMKEGIPFVVFSTYHSSEKFAESGIEPHLTIHDEAHNLVSREFSKAATLTSQRDVYFTATEKITGSEDGLGMNNSDIFGEMIYVRTPKQMIDKGEMLPPRVHTVRAAKDEEFDSEKIDTDYEALLKSIYDAFLSHQGKIRIESYNPSELGAKVLVVCRGQQDLIEMFKSKVLDQFRTQYPDIHLFALSSDFGLYIDGEFHASPVTNVKKHALIKKIKALSPSDKCIVFHVDMIGEGIDVPGLTGVMPFRNCELAKFVQNICRASRLHTVDRREFYADNITPDDRIKWIKPYSWVIIPSFLADSDGFQSRWREIIDKLRYDFGFIPRQHTFIDNVKGLDDEEEIDKVNEKTKNRKHSDSGLDEFDHDFEPMTMIERIIFESDVADAEQKYQAKLDKMLGEDE